MISENCVWSSGEMISLLSPLMSLNHRELFVVKALHCHFLIYRNHTFAIMQMPEHSFKMSCGYFQPSPDSDAFYVLRLTADKR